MTIEIFNQEVDSELMELLLDADPSIDSINEYINDSIKFVAKENNLIAGIVVFLIHHDEAEVKNISVKKIYRRQGVGTRLLSELLKYASGLQLKRIVVGTGNSSLDQLKFYQTLGFRMYGIIEDYFEKYSQPIFENDIQCRDLIILRKEL